MKVIIAIGGEEVGPLDTNGQNKQVIVRAFHEEIIRRTGKKHPNILYIPAAKDDREDFIAGFEKFYTNLGAGKIDVLRLINHKPSPKEIADKIAVADAVYVNGGNSHRMLRLWKLRGVDRLLKQAWQQGTVMAGHSAGSLCWFKYACSDAFYKKKPFRATAMGWIPAVLCPHFDSEPIRQTVLQKIMKRTPGLVAIGVDEHAAIEIIDDKYRILSATPTSKARKLYWEKGEYISEDLELTETFKALPQLLRKP